MDVKAVQAELARFAAERGWDDAQTPKNLAMALAVEASVVLELFKWQRDDAPRAAESARLRDSAADAIADVILQALRLADRLHVDVTQAVTHRLARNAAKYPVAVRDAPGPETEVVVLEVGIDELPGDAVDEASSREDTRPAPPAIAEMRVDPPREEPRHAAPIPTEASPPADSGAADFVPRADSAPAARRHEQRAAPGAKPARGPERHAPPSPTPRARDREVPALERPKPARVVEVPPPKVEAPPPPPNVEAPPPPPKVEALPVAAKIEPPPPARAEAPRPAVELPPRSEVEASQAPEPLSVTPLTLPTQPPPARSEADTPVDRYPNLDPDAALALAKAIAKKLDHARSRDPLLRELHDELETLKRSLYAPSVKKAWVAGSLKTVRGMLEQATSEPFGEEIDAVGHMGKVDRLLKE